MSWSVPDPDTTCRGYGFVITAVKLRGCQQLSEKVSARRGLGVANTSDISQFGLDVQPRPHSIDRFRCRKDEVDTSDRSLGRVPSADTIAFGFRMPDRLHLKQCPVAAADVVLPKLQRGSPPCTFEFPAVLLLKHGTVAALAADARRGSLNHVSIMNDKPCGSSVPTRCELSQQIWGQISKFCEQVVGRAIVRL